MKSLRIFILSLRRNECIWENCAFTRIIRWTKIKLRAFITIYLHAQKNSGEHRCEQLPRLRSRRLLYAGTYVQCIKHQKLWYLMFTHGSDRIRCIAALMQSLIYVRCTIPRYPVRDIPRDEGCVSSHNSYRLEWQIAARRPACPDDDKMGRNLRGKLMAPS